MSVDLRVKGEPFTRVTCRVPILCHSEEQSDEESKLLLVVSLRRLHVTLSLSNNERKMKAAGPRLYWPRPPKAHGSCSSALSYLVKLVSLHSLSGHTLMVGRCERVHSYEKSGKENEGRHQYQGKAEISLPDQAC